MGRVDAGLSSRRGPGPCCLMRDGPERRLIGLLPSSKVCAAALVGNRDQCPASTDRYGVTRATGWTYKWHHDAYELKNGLQAAFAYDLVVREAFTQGEIPQAQKLNVRIVSLVTLSETQCRQPSPQGEEVRELDWGLVGVLGLLPCRRPPALVGVKRPFSRDDPRQVCPQLVLCEVAIRPCALCHQDGPVQLVMRLNYKKVASGRFRVALSVRHSPS
jgi:hypothetical protein